jgi:hypothetical protein
MSEHSPLPWPSREIVAREIRLAMLDNPFQEQPFNKRAEARERIANEAADVILARCSAANEQLIAALEWYAKDYDYATGCSQWDGGAKARAALSNLKEPKS